MSPLLRICCWLILGLTLLGSHAAELSAAPPAVLQLERVDVPAKSPELWPKFAEGMIAVSRQEFERRWNAIRPQQQQPPAIVLESLALSATVSGKELTAGSGHFRLRSTHTEPAWLSLKDVNLAVTAITRDGEQLHRGEQRHRMDAVAKPAVDAMPAEGGPVSVIDPQPQPSVGSEVLWGAAPDGRLWMYADPPEADWSFRWTLTGREVAGSLMFDLQIPVALTNSLSLKVPAGWLLTSPQSSIQLIAGPTSAGWTAWEVITGSESQFRLVVSQPQSRPETPLVLYRRQLTAGIREDHLRFEATFQPEVLGGEIGDLQFSIPANAELDSVTWGSDVPLVWSRTSTNNARQTIRAQLPDRQRGVIRQVRLEGIVSQRPGAVVTLPQIELQGGVFRSGGVQVAVIRPLQISSIRTLGCRQESPVLVTPEGETFQFQQTVPTSQVTLEVRRPRSTLNAEVFTRLKCQRDEWTFSSEIQWSSATGSAFQLAVRIPADWEVSNVRAMSAAGEEERISWEPAEDSEGWSRIAVELLEALSPERNRTLLIEGRRRPPEQRTRYECPMVVPLDCQTVQRLFEVIGGEPFEVYSDPQSTGDVVEPSRLTGNWRRFHTWPVAADLTAASPRLPLMAQSLWFRTVDPAPAPQMAVYARSQPITADVRVDVETDQSLITETFEVRVKPTRPVPLGRLLLFLTEPGEEIAWQVLNPAHWDVVGTRIPREHQPLATPPETGELWEIRLPGIVADEIQLRGVRVKPLSLPMSVGLVHVPHSTSTVAKVTLTTPERSTLQPAARGIEDVADAVNSGSTVPESLVRRREWKYERTTDELQLVSRRMSLQESPCPATLQLRSLISAHEGDYDYHRAIVQCPTYQRSLRFGFARLVELLHVEFDGQPQLIGSNSEVVLAPGVGDALRTLTIVYRSTAQRGFFQDSRPIPQPLCADVLWTDCRWDFALPPIAQIAAEPAGIRFDRQEQAATWSQRMFGPLGRSAVAAGDFSGVFMPWNAESWRKLLPGPPTLSNPPTRADSGLTAPPEWRQNRGFAPRPTGVWSLRTWNRDRLQLLSWLALLGVLSVLLAVRATGLTIPLRIWALWLAIWTGAAVAIEPPFVELVGAVIAATCLGWLVPGRWLHWQGPRLRRSPEVPAGSTQSFALPRGAATATGLLLAIVWIQGVIWALPPEPRAERTLLVPVDERGQPTLLVYLTRENWDALVAASSQPEETKPNILLQLAEYDATLAGGQRVTVSGTFDVLVLGTEAQVQLPLPLSSFGPAATQGCLVDDRPATVTALPEGMGVQISWTRPLPPISAVGAPVVTRHRVRLDWQHAWERESGMAVLKLNVPCAAASKLEVWQVPAREDSLTAIEFRRPLANQVAIPQVAVIRDEPIRRASGLVTHFRVCWKERGPAAEPVEVQIDALEAWALQASVIDVRSRTTFQPRTGAAQRLLVRLPKQAVIRRWSSTLPAEFRVILQGENTTALLEFAEPLTVPATIEVDYVTPVANPLGEFQWSGMVWQEVDGARLVAGQRLWAIAANDEIRLQPLTLEESGLAPVALETARASFGDLIADRLPRVVYQVSGHNPAAFETLQSSTPRRILLWQQTATVTPDRLKWELEGELEVTGLPVYTHVLSIDRRLNIESISVREGGAERLVRWSESRSSGSPGTTRLTLFLSDPATELQRITLNGSIPLNASAAVPLPNVRCDDAQLTGGRLVVRTPPTINLEWLGARGLRELTAIQEPVAGGFGVNTSRIFDQTESEWRATVRMLAAVENQSAQAVHVIHGDDPQSLQATSLWRLPLTRLNEAVTIIVPSPWELADESQVINGQLDVVRGLDGVWNLVISADGAADEVQLDLRLRVQRSALRAGMLPLPRPLGELSAGFQVWIAELTRLPQSPLVSDLLPRLDDQLPLDWDSGRWPMPTLADNDRLRWWHLPPEEFLIPIAPRSTEIQPASIAWLEHTLWMSDREHGIGLTQVRLAEPAVTLFGQFPDTVQFQGVMIGSQMGVTRTEVKGQVQMARRDGQPFVEAWLIWQQPLSDSHAIARPEQFQWPMFPKASIGQLAITLFPAAGDEVRGTGSWVAGDWVDRSLLRLEVLSDQLRMGANGQQTERLAAEFSRAYELTALQFGRHQTALGDARSERQSRWQDIVDQINQLPPALTAGAENGSLMMTNPLNINSETANPQTLTSEAANSGLTGSANSGVANSSFVPRVGQFLTDHPGAVYGMLPPHAGDVRVWSVERPWLRWVAGAVVTLLCWPALALGIRPRWGQWLQAHPAVATFLLGLVWWWFLSVSIVGFAMMMSALYHLIFDAPSAPVAAETA